MNVVARKIARYVKSIQIRKLLFAGISAFLVILGSALCFYFQLGLQAGLGNIIAYSCFILIVILTIFARKRIKKDNYTCAMLSAYAAFNDLSQYHSTSAALSAAEEYTNAKIGGFEGYKALYKENKEMLGWMLATLEPFGKYANKKGLGLKVTKLALKHDLQGFCDFAMLDMLITNSPDDAHVHKFVASTRWQPVYSRYAKGVLKWYLFLILPWIVWLIGTNILTSSFDTTYAISGAALFLMRWGLLCIFIQLMNFFGNSKTTSRIASDLVPDENGNVVVPEMDFEACVSFAQLSPDYAQAATAVGIPITTEDASVEQAEAGAQEEEPVDPFADFE